MRIVEARLDGVVAQAQPLRIFEENLVEAQEGLLSNVRTRMLQQVEEVRQGLPPEVLGDDVREAADGESRVVDGLPAPSGALQFLLEQVRREQNYRTPVWRVQSLTYPQYPHTLEREARGAYDLHGRKDSPRHAVAHHLEEGQFLEGVRLNEEVRGL